MFSNSGPYVLLTDTEMELEAFLDELETKESRYETHVLPFVPFWDASDSIEALRMAETQVLPEPEVAEPRNPWLLKALGGFVVGASLAGNLVWLLVG